MVGVGDHVDGGDDAVGGVEVEQEHDRRLSVLPPGHPMGYHDCFAAFVADVHATVRGGGADTDGAASFPTFEDAARTAALTDAVLAAARTRTWTEVPTP